MNGIPRQNVVIILAELEADPAYLALAEPATDAESNDFRQGVQALRRLCLQVHPREATDAEIRNVLGRLHADPVGRLAPFVGFIDRALRALG